MHNYIVFDLETTGLDPAAGHEIVQIAAHAIHGPTLADHSSGKFSVIIKPNKPEKASPEALKVIGPELWEKAQKEGLDRKVALERLSQWVLTVRHGKTRYDNPMMVGHNIQFDYNFAMSEMLEYKVIKDRSDFPFHIRPLCTAQMLHIFWGHLADTPNNRLDTLLEKFHYHRSSGTHDAVEDVDLTAKCFIRIMRLCRAVEKMLVIQKSE